MSSESNGRKPDSTEPGPSSGTGTRSSARAPSAWGAVRDALASLHNLDALLFPGVSNANISARPGYPSVTVPFGFVPVAAGTGAAAYPAGFEPKPSPYNVTFAGTACSEPKLIELAYSFEQATKKRQPPPLFP